MILDTIPILYHSTPHVDKLISIFVSISADLGRLSSKPLAAPPHL